MNIKIGNNDVLVKIVYKNNKNIYFRFDDKLNLIVTCPKHTLDEYIFSLIEKNNESLLKMYEKMVDKKTYDNEFWYLGKKYNVVYNKELDEININNDYIYAKDDEALEQFLLQEAKRIFTLEADICSKCFNNLPEYKIKLRKMKTRWGVCNRKDNSITLNTELIKKDIKLIDYVIIHEMAHFYEGNHSKAFWNIVSLACPNYKQRRADLKK